MNNTAPKSRCKRYALHLDSVCDRVACSAVRDFVRNCCNYAKISLRTTHRRPCKKYAIFAESGVFFAEKMLAKDKRRKSVFPFFSLELPLFSLSLKLRYAIIFERDKRANHFPQSCARIRMHSRTLKGSFRKRFLLRMQSIRRAPVNCLGKFAEVSRRKM